VMAYRSSFSFGWGLTPWVGRLIIANTVIFLFTYMNENLLSYFAFVPSRVLTQPWTAVTYMFAHGGIGHLFFNMLGLFFFGPALESRWGSREFIKFYIICGLGGAALSFLLAPANPIIGASAAVYGIMLAFAMNWPEMPIYIWGIFPIQARVLVIILAAISLLSAFSGSGGNVAHFAHLGGFAAGFLYLKLDRRGGGAIAKLRKFSAKRRMTVVPGNKETTGRPATPQRPDRRATDAQEAQLLDELDRVLQKISTDGMSSLTPSERRLLDDVSRRYRQN
ncbi:MAG: rhomboid family intramembrane serine protease, partial [Longimicrobiales bacterium]